jgi:hypothetical protein
LNGAVDYRGIGGKRYVVDLDDLSNPKELPPWQFNGDGRPHGVWLNKEGTRLYAGQPVLLGNTGSSIGPDGLVIDDVSDYQYRLPNPQIRIVSKLFWTDQGQAEDMYPFDAHGRHYVVSTDESDGAGGAGGIKAARERACRGDPRSSAGDLDRQRRQRFSGPALHEGIPGAAQGPVRGLGRVKRSPLVSFNRSFVTTGPARTRRAGPQRRR